MNQFVATKLNLDKHYSLFQGRELTYLLNGDIKGYESGSQELFAQNIAANSLCFELGEGESFAGPGIQLDNNEHVFFIAGSNKIIIANLTTCEYTTWAQDDCLNFSAPVRGVFKYDALNNSRAIYFIDGVNPNRHALIDLPYPKVMLTSECDTCEAEYSEDLDCGQLQINKDFITPCLTIQANNSGTLAPGTYQVGFAFSQNGNILTDFYYSDVIKVGSTRDNVSIEVNVSCVDSPFEEYTIILASTTRENSLVIYNYGTYRFPTNTITLSSLDGATVVSTQVALSKRTVFDKSEHITTNSELLLFGKSQVPNAIDYQLKANEIEVEWVEKLVPAKEAHLYPTFLRDEVYDFVIEWKDLKGQIRGVYPIPGRALNNEWQGQITSPSGGGGFLIIEEGDDAPTGDITVPEMECGGHVYKVWEVENTAYVTEDLSGTCEMCSEVDNIGKIGKMGYYECRDLTYPDDPSFGDLACQPIRRHRFPDSSLSHIHDHKGCIEESVPYSYTKIDFETGEPYEVTGTYEVTRFQETECVTILGVRFKNIQWPEEDGMAGFRFLFAQRTEGKKSILHKGIAFNCATEVVNTTGINELITYPNYPYNDHWPDVFISTTQTGQQPIVDDWTGAAEFERTKFTYHSPDIHYKESKNEFGDEFKLYTAEWGAIAGEFTKVYKHPKVSLGLAGSPPYIDHVFQYDSVAKMYDFYAYGSSAPIIRNRWNINYSQYLLPIKQFINDNQKFNNLYREPSYYVELNGLGPAPEYAVERDTSRVLMSELFSPTKQERSFSECSEVTRGGEEYPIQGTTYYTGIRRFQPNQYGQYDSNNYIPIDHCYTYPDTTGTFEEVTVFGGDVYISRHAVLRKMPLFTEWLYDIPFDANETLLDYRDKRNVYYPHFWYDESLSPDQFHLDNYGVEDGADVGVIYTSVNGVSYFWGESEFISTYRESDALPNSQFYPMREVKELTRSDIFQLEPLWLYNFALLGESIDRGTVTSLISIQETDNTGEHAVHFSLKEDQQSGRDNWLTFLPLNYSLLPKTYGEFTGMHYVDQYSILFALENMTLYSQEDYTLLTNEGNNIFVGQGDIFTRRLRKLSNAVTGFSGSVDPFSFINTNYGTFYFDRYRKTFLRWGEGLAPLEDLKGWINQYTSNSKLGYEGLITVYDNLSQKVYITDKEKGWTLSYSPAEQGFVSFHSFIPDWYVPSYNKFLTIKDQGLWVHDHNRKDLFQEYYGETVPFEIEFVIFSPTSQDLQAIEVYADFYEITDYNSVTPTKAFFDKGFVYNNHMSSGMLDISYKDKARPAIIQNAETSQTAEVTQVYESLYRINKFENNQSGSPNITFASDGWNYTLQNITSKPPHSREELKGRWFKVHLIASQTSATKIMVQLNVPQQNKIAQ